MGRYMTLPDGTRFDLDEEIELSDGTWIRLRPYPDVNLFGA